MELGGNDVHFACAMSNPLLALVLSYIKLVWPDAIFKIDGGEVETPTLPCLLFVSANRDVYATCERLGVVPEIEGLCINLDAREDGLDFVMGVEEGCPGERLVEGIIATLEALFALKPLVSLRRFIKTDPHDSTL